MTSDLAALVLSGISLLVSTIALRKVYGLSAGPKSTVEPEPIEPEEDTYVPPAWYSPHPVMSQNGENLARPIPPPRGPDRNWRSPGIS